MYDLVVTYLDSSKKDWQEAYNKYRNEEINKGIQKEDNRQAFGIERIRDWGTFKYFLRGVEKNCKWIRTIIIIMQNKNQLPKWLNLDSPILRVVYHDEFIPKEILPTFNACEIGMYVSNIKDLSNFYVMCDDDYFFLNNTPVTMFFKDGKTVQSFNPTKRNYDTKGSDAVFYKILLNNSLIEGFYKEKYNKPYFYISHLPEARDKKLEQLVLHDFKDVFIDNFKKSKFRRDNHFSAQMFPNIIKENEMCIFSNDMDKFCKYVTLKSNINFDDYKYYNIVCFNDTEQLDNYNKTKSKLIKFLESMLPEKSNFEK